MTNIYDLTQEYLDAHPAEGVTFEDMAYNLKWDANKEFGERFDYTTPLDEAHIMYVRAQFPLYAEENK